MATWSFNLLEQSGILDRAVDEFLHPEQSGRVVFFPGRDNLVGREHKAGWVAGGAKLHAEASGTITIVRLGSI